MNTDSQASASLAALAVNETSRAGDRALELYRAALLLKAKAIARKVSFSCFLDEQPTDLVPRRGPQDLLLEVEPTELFVNSLLRYQAGADLPAEVRHRAGSLEAFLPGYPLAWIGDAGTGVWSPYWLRGEYAEVIRSLEPGEPAPTDLSVPVRHILQRANILCRIGDAERSRGRWARLCQEARRNFESNAYVIVRGLLHPFLLAALRRYYRDVLAQGSLPLGDPQVERRYAVKDEVLAGFFHHQLVDVISEVAGKPLKPSYLYFASYQPGAVLRPHRDREQSEFSFSFLVDYVPEPVDTSGWSLFFERKGKPRMTGAADLGIGDGVLYRGCELIHHRNELPVGHVSTSLFFFYVPTEFTGDLW